MKNLNVFKSIELLEKGYKVLFAEIATMERESNIQKALLVGYNNATSKLKKNLITI